MTAILNSEDQKLFDAIHLNSNLTKIDLEDKLFEIYKDMEELVEIGAVLYIIADQLNLNIDQLLENIELTPFFLISEESSNITISGEIVKIKEIFRWNDSNRVKSIIVENNGEFIKIGFWNKQILVLNQLLSKGLKIGDKIIMSGLSNFKSTTFDSCKFNVNFNIKAKLQII